MEFGLQSAQSQCSLKAELQTWLPWNTSQRGMEFRL